tara:strand:- start:1479 stop:2414 length:936 start_codon:yes stop_codon:yes gene_type:complete
MAVTNANSTYAGTFSGKYISAALLSASTLDAGLITIMPNVKYKSVIQTGSFDSIVKNSSCDFETGAGTLTLDEKVIQPKELQVNLVICKKDLQDSWEAEAMGFSAFDNLAPSFEEYVIGYTAAKVANKIETNIWEGAVGNAGEFDGFGVLSTAQLPGANIIAAVAGGVNDGNVLAEMGKVADAVPTTVYGQEDLFIYVSSNVARAYVRALGGFAANGLGANGIDGQGTTWYTNGSLSFDGIPVVVGKGMANNKMYAAQKSNLFFGTGLLNSTNEVKVLDMSDLDGSRNVRVIMRFTGGCQIGTATDVIAYA